MTKEEEARARRSLPIAGASRRDETPSADRVLVAPDVLLDSRLALFHRAERWLAVADLHYGYELSLRAAGALIPLWGMDEIEARLRALLADHRPARLILCGDLVHSRASRDEARALFDRLHAFGDNDGGCEIIPLAGNHDRRAFAADELRDSFATPAFFFHHGDRPADAATLGARIEILGHDHPAATLDDGAGFRVKLPAFVQAAKARRWVLPAFSPWAAGGVKQGGYGAGARWWACSPRRIFPPR